MQALCPTCSRQPFLLIKSFWSYFYEKDFTCISIHSVAQNNENSARAFADGCTFGFTKINDFKIDSTDH